MLLESSGLCIEISSVRFCKVKVLQVKKMPMSFWVAFADKQEKVKTWKYGVF